MSIRMVATVNDKLVREKLLLAAPRILAQNRVLITAMLEPVKSAVEVQTPIGPGHFGYHGRDTVKLEITSVGVKTTGELKAASQVYWREYGTRGHFRRKASALRSYMAAIGGTGGEPALMVANKALGATKRFINFYYNGMANWWRS